MLSMLTSVLNAVFGRQQPPPLLEPDTASLSATELSISSKILSILTGTSSILKPLSHSPLPISFSNPGLRLLSSTSLAATKLRSLPSSWISFPSPTLSRKLFDSRRRPLPKSTLSSPEIELCRDSPPSPRSPANKMLDACLPSSSSSVTPFSAPTALPLSSAHSSTNIASLSRNSALSPVVSSPSLANQLRPVVLSSPPVKEVWVEASEGIVSSFMSIEGGHRGLAVGIWRSVRNSIASTKLHPTPGRGELILRLGVVAAYNLGPEGVKTKLDHGIRKLGSL
ncbi:hypothetical protein P7C70_g3393, partial [Phenoliferia sp. Uapishka_3]